LVEVRRAGVVESRHRGHVVQVGVDGRVETLVGDADVLVNLRSSVKPFTLIALIEGGAADAFALTPQELALMSSSHSGEDLHVRTLQAVFRRANLSQSLLACGAEGMPLDIATAARLARDGEQPSPVRHMCSGHHAASLLLSRHMGWDLPSYWQPDHPSQAVARDAVARAFGVRMADLRVGVDGCGIQTFAFPLVEVARAYALLADPHAVAPDSIRRKLAPTLLRVRDAMMGAPEMVGGTRERLDTVLMKVQPGRLVSKGGNEALSAVGLLAGSRGRDSDPAGIAIKIEDGDGRGRASHAATVETLAQLDVLDDRALRVLGHYHRPPALDPRGKVVAESVPTFSLAPISERF
jgi:L-asparaginase II